MKRVELPCVVKVDTSGGWWRIRGGNPTSARLARPGELERELLALFGARKAKAPGAGGLAFPKPTKPEGKAKKTGKRKAKADRFTGDVYREVNRRAGGMCECGCGNFVNAGRMLDSAQQMDDFWGGARHESAEECWMIRADCHRAKTDNRPSRMEWLRRFESHCRLYGFKEQVDRCRREREAEELIRQAAEVSRG